MTKNLGIIKRDKDYKPNFSTNGFYLKIAINGKQNTIEIDSTNQDIYVNNKFLCGYENLQNMDNEQLLETIKRYLVERLTK